MKSDERLERYARLAVEVGANVGEGQVVWLTAAPEHAPLVRAITRCAYERGARYVDVDYQDPYARRARIQNAPDDSLGWTPPWVLAKIDHVAGEHGAMIQIIGEPDPELMADLDGARVGKTRMLELSERYMDAMNKRLINWSIVAYPTEGWAASIFGEPDTERLWDALVDTTRLDEPDPVDAWRRHIDMLVERAALLDERRFDCLRFRGPRNQSDDRADSALTLVRRGRRDRGRPPARRQHADGRGLRDPRPPADRGNRALDNAARARGDDRP